jgi:hypothetical protein
MPKRGEVAALEARRFEAARLFARGESQAAVGRGLWVTAVAAHRWFHAWQTEGKTGLKAAGRLGHKPSLEAQQRAGLDRALRRGPLAHGFATDLWTLPASPRCSSALRACDTIQRTCGGSCRASTGRCNAQPGASSSGTRTGG